MKLVARVFSSLSFLVLGYAAFAQSLPVGMPLAEEAARRMQIRGEGLPNTSFTIRPLFARAEISYDSLYQRTGVLAATSNTLSFAKGKGLVRLLPVVARQQYTTHHPYGWNDGSMIPAKGYQAQLLAGVYAKLGPLSLQVQPELVYAQNKSFPTFPASHSNRIWKSYYRIQNRIDDPEKFGSGAYVKVFPGQSSLRFNFKKLSVGASTENLWWGPGRRNALIMSNHAPGFAHLTFNTTAPVISPIGSFEWQVVAGLLQGSGYLPADTGRTFNGTPLYQPKPAGQRYINGMVITWQPKWTKGLFLGLSRVFHQYTSGIPASLNGYLPVLGAFFKENAQDENAYGRDQLLSLFLRLVLAESKAEIYAEYGRNDHSQNLGDLLQEPEHARAYVVGGRKLFAGKNGKEVELMMELTQLQNPSTQMVRDLEGWYTHYQVRHGYTNRGQVLGAGIGTGSNSQTMGISWIKGVENFGVFLERVVRNNDFYFDAFTPLRDFGSHWVDISLNVNKTWQHQRFLFTADLSLVHTLNYQWQRDKDVNNLRAALAVAYLF